eukprot:evm.model.NODE_42676_length_23521_cov_42.546192.1
MSDDDGEVYAYSDDGGSDVDYAYGSDEVSLGVWEEKVGVDREGDGCVPPYLDVDQCRVVIACTRSGRSGRAMSKSSLVVPSE